MLLPPMKPHGYHTEVCEDGPLQPVGYFPDRLQLESARVLTLELDSRSIPKEQNYFIIKMILSDFSWRQN